MEFKKIQLNGFKSFAEKTNFLIEDGLTGIVGPNGCGKEKIAETIQANSSVKDKPFVKVNVGALPSPT